MHKDAADVRVWKRNYSGLFFFSKSLYRKLEPFDESRFACALIWMGLLPPKSRGIFLVSCEGQDLIG